MFQLSSRKRRRVNSWARPIRGPEQLEDRRLLAADFLEPNDSLAEAVDLGQGDQYHIGLTIHESGNDDWYRWTPFESGSVTIQTFFEHASGDIDLELYSSRGGRITGSTSATDNEEVSTSVSYGESYYIRVFGYAGATQDHYDLYIDGQPSTQIFPDFFEDNDTAATAADLGTGDQLHKSLTLDYDQIEFVSDPHDWYKWTAPADGTLNVEILFKNSLGDIDVQLRDADQNLLASSTTTNDNEQVSASVTRGSSYYIHVYGYSNASSPGYDLLIDGPEILPDVYEPNDSFAQAWDLGSEDQAHGGLTIHSPGNEDWFKWTSPGLGSVDVNLYFPHAEGDLDLYLYDAAHSLLTSSTSVTDNEHVAALASPSEEFYIQVVGFGGSVHPGYELQIASHMDFALDPDLPPIVETLPGVGGGDPRRVAAVRAPDGTVGSFVLDEVILYAPEPSILSNFMTTYNAEILVSPDLPDPPPSVPPEKVRGEVDGGDYYLMRVDLSTADATGFSDWMAELGFDDTLTFSTGEALQLNAIMAKERVVSGLQITPNVVYAPDTPDNVISETEEYSLGGGNFYNSFAFDWVHDGDIQLSRAWQYFDLLNLNTQPSLAIVDQGFSLTADFPAASSVPQYDFIHDDYNALGDPDKDGGWHGTGALSTAAAGLDDQFGSVGTGGLVVAPTLLQLTGTYFNMARSIRTAVKWGADVVSVSWGGECGWWCRNFGIFSGMDSLTNAVESAKNNDVIVLASAGNDGNNLDDQTYIPAEIDHVIAVGALNLANKRAVRSGEPWSGTGTLWWSSNYGSKVDIWAPGDSIDTTPNPSTTGSTAFFNGTSAATPYVAGVVAMMKAIKPDLTVSQALNALQSTANTSTDSRVASGYIDAYEAVKAVAALAGLQPQGDLYEPNDVTPRANLPSSFTKTIAPGDVDKYALGFVDYAAVQATVTYVDQETSGNELTARLEGVAGTDVNGVISLSNTFIKPPSASLEVSGSSTDSINSYTVQWTATAATIAPDAYDDQTPAGEVRNDSLTSAAVISDVVKANLLLATVSIDNLNFDTLGDVDYFTIQLDEATDPLTGAPECYQPGDPEYGSPNATQGYFEISVHPAWLGDGIQRPFEIVVYKNGQPLNSSYATQSSLSYRIECPHQDFPDGEITFSVRDTAGRNFYGIGLHYQRADMRFYPPPDWLLQAEPPLFWWPGDWPPVPDGPHPAEAPLVYPRNPLVVDNVLGGELVDPLPPEYMLVDWTEGGDYLAEILLPNGGDLNVKLINAQEEVVAEALTLPGPESTDSPMLKRLEAPGLPPGGYVLEFSGGPFGVPYILSAGAAPALAADFNGDGAVTGRDFLAWQRGFGMTGAAKSDGDANEDQRVDAADLLVWQEMFGATQVGGTQALVSQSSAMTPRFNGTFVIVDNLVARPSERLPLRSEWRARYARDEALTSSIEFSGDADSRLTFQFEREFSTRSAWRATEVESRAALDIAFDDYILPDIDPGLEDVLGDPLRA